MTRPRCTVHSDQTCGHVCAREVEEMTRWHVRPRTGWKPCSIPPTRLLLYVSHHEEDLTVEGHFRLEYETFIHTDKEPYRGRGYPECYVQKYSVLERPRDLCHEMFTQLSISPPPRPSMPKSVFSSLWDRLQTTPQRGCPCPWHRRRRRESRHVRRLIALTVCVILGAVGLRRTQD